MDSFIAEEDEDSEGSNPSEVSKGSSQSNEKYPESSVARGGKRVSQAERNRASVLEKLKQSREKAKRSQAKTRNKTLYKASAKVNRGINFEETIEEGDNDVNSGDSDGTISPSKKSVADRKRYVIVKDFIGGFDCLREFEFFERINFYISFA